MAFLSESGCDYLAKPFDIVELMQNVRRLLAAPNYL
jgi:DNA-binding response OmpR family regulator